MAVSGFVVSGRGLPDGSSIISTGPRTVPWGQEWKNYVDSNIKKPQASTERINTS